MQADHQLSAQANKTSICSVALNIIDYSTMSVPDQTDTKKHFNALINEATVNIAPNDRITLDTGDGAAISLIAAPEQALFLCMNIRDRILQHNRRSVRPLSVRIGVDLETVKGSDIHDQPNIVGDSISVAKKVMSVAEPNQIKASDAFYQATQQFTEKIADIKPVGHAFEPASSDQFTARHAPEQASSDQFTWHVLEQASSDRFAEPSKANSLWVYKATLIVQIVLLAALLAFVFYWPTLTRLLAIGPADPLKSSSTISSHPSPVVPPPALPIPTTASPPAPALALEPASAPALALEPASAPALAPEPASAPALAPEPASAPAAIAQPPVLPTVPENVASDEAEIHDDAQTKSVTTTKKSAKRKRGAPGVYSTKQADIDFIEAWDARQKLEQVRPEQVRPEQVMPE